MQRVFLLMTTDLSTSAPTNPGHHFTAMSFNLLGKLSEIFPESFFNFFVAGQPTLLDEKSGFFYFPEKRRSYATDLAIWSLMLKVIKMFLERI